MLLLDSGGGFAILAVLLHLPVLGFLQDRQGDSPWGKEVGTASEQQREVWGFPALCLGRFVSDSGACDAAGHREGLCLLSSHGAVAATPEMHLWAGCLGVGATTPVRLGGRGQVLQSGYLSLIFILASC